MGSGLEGAVQQHLQYIVRTAQTSPAGGGPAWDALLQHYGVRPFDASERAMSVKYMNLARGALPGEVRVVLEGLRDWALAQPGADAMRGEIDALVDRETARYEQSIGIVAPPEPAAPAGPAAPSLGSIFANAEQTSKEVPWANMKYKQVATLTCVHCGGPQEQPRDSHGLSFFCKFCRRPIAGSIEPNQ